jgi:hypothetical protein
VQLSLTLKHMVAQVHSGLAVEGIEAEAVGALSGAAGNPTT